MASLRDEQRDTIIAALMSAEDFDFAYATRFVDAFEKPVICPRCGAELSDADAHELSGTIWDGWMSRSA